MSSRSSTFDPVLLHLSNFALQRHRIDDDSVANQVELAFAENAAWDGVQHMFAPIKLEGVPRIGTSLEPRDDVVLRSQYIHDFTFPFVSPLEAQQYVDFHVPFVKWQK